MKLLSVICVFGLFWHGSSSSSCISEGDNAGSSDATVGTVTDAILEYTLKQYKALVADEDSKDENIFTSPYSIWSALATTYLGSRQKSSDELRTLLGLEGLQKRAVEGQIDVLENDVQSSKGDVFSVANKIAFDRASVRLRQCVLGDPDLDIEAVNFSSEHEKARLALNAWVGNKTHGKIPELLKKGTVDQFTALVILNAVYFKGEWKYKFKPEASNSQFTSSTGQTSQVPMMALKNHLKYNLDEDLGLEGVELPYASGKYSMVVMLPSTDQTIDELVEKLEDGKLKTYLNNFYKTNVNVRMPKFKIDKSYKLKKLLQKLGAPSMFQHIDISGIVGSSPALRVTSVIHQAFIEVNEEGAEAAAATAVVSGSRAGIRFPPKDLVFDRPFLFILKNTETGAILFMGVVRKL